MIQPVGLCEHNLFEAQWGTTEGVIVSLITFQENQVKQLTEPRGGWSSRRPKESEMRGARGLLPFSVQ